MALRLLVIDDEAPVLRSIARLFQREHEVVTASDAIKGLEIALNEDFDGILVDMRMPKMGGTGVRGEADRGPSRDPAKGRPAHGRGRHRLDRPPGAADLEAPDTRGREASHLVVGRSEVSVAEAEPGLSAVGVFLVADAVAG